MSDVSDLRELSEWLKGGDEHAMARHVDDAADTIEALRAELHEATKTENRLRDACATGAETIHALRAEVERLRAALTKYGRHTKYCRLLDSFDERTECTCGFERATGRQEKSLSEES